MGVLARGFVAVAHGLRRAPTSRMALLGRFQAASAVTMFGHLAMVERSVLARFGSLPVMPGSPIGVL